MLCDLDDEISHGLGRHQVGATFGPTETRQVDRGQWAKPFDLQPDRTVGVDAFRPGAGQEDRYAVGLAAARNTIQLTPVRITNGFAVATLHRGEARFQKGDQVAENNATIDLVLAEIVMPEITGIELA